MSLRIIFFSVTVRFSVRDWPLRYLLIALKMAAEVPFILAVPDIGFECLLVLVLSLERLIMFRLA